MNTQMNMKLQNAALLSGRLLLSLIFIVSGLGKVANFSGTAAYMASAGLPFVDLLLVLTIVVELGGGLLLALGWKARWAAAAIFLFLIPATLVFHAFWAMPAEQASMQQIQFMKNLAIMGGMLVFAALGPGAWALERIRSAQ